MNARKTKAASVAAVPVKGKSASAGANSTKSRSAEDKTRAKVKAEDKTKAKTAGVPAKDKTKSKSAGVPVEAAMRYIMEDIGRAGVAWDDSNTTDLAKVFTVRFHLDFMSRIYLGMLLSRCGLTPEEYLAGLLREKFSEAVKELEKDKAAKDFCDAVFFHSIASLVNIDGFMRLAFVPAIIA